MTIAKITVPGLVAIGASVVLLWSFLIGERLTVRRAVQEQARVLREMELLRQRQRSEPVLAPIWRLPRPHRAPLG